MFLDFLRNKELALFLVRLVVGSVFVLHGGQKVFGWLGGPGLTGFVTWLGTLGVPAWLGYVAAFVELVGGCMVLFGIAAEIGALFLAIQMAVAIYLVHWPHGYFVQNNGFEYPLSLIVLCLAIIVGGAGKV
jgi:putative oxidoreductase